MFRQWRAASIAASERDVVAPGASQVWNLGAPDLSTGTVQAWCGDGPTLPLHA